MLGDVNFEDVKKVDGFMTKTPGGVGPLTVLKLINNVINGYGER
jgi:5,10-methylene-tetrahydrofolate dehydrogenase/methenyl tetrahydrofolate cyclohydrolase